MENDFDRWNESKKKVDAQNVEVDKFPQEGEVWMCLLGKNIGFEQNGSDESFSRPMLVVKKFNNHMFWAVPLSTKQKQFDFYYNFTDLEQRPVSVILAQMRLISVKRLVRLLYQVDDDLFHTIKNRLRSFLS